MRQVSLRAVMRRCLAPLVAATLLAVPSFASAQASPIDDLLKRATDAFNDLNYSRADSIARQVLSISTISAAQRTRAQIVIVAAAYPEEAAAQRRDAALAMLKLMVRSDLTMKMPPELTWAGLDALVEEAKRQTFVLDVSAEPTQTAVGPEGMAKISLRSNKSASYRVVIAPVSGGAAAVFDSLAPTTAGEITFRTMRNERPIFSTGAYNVTVIAHDAASKDSVVSQRVMRVDAPALTFLTVPTKLDSTRMLPERSGKMGSKAILPAIVVGGTAFVLSSVLRGEGQIATKVSGDPKGIAIGGALAASAIFAGFRDKGRPIPSNIAANRAAGDAFQKSVVDANTENRRRIVEYKTVLVLEEAR